MRPQPPSSPASCSSGGGRGAGQPPGLLVAASLTLTYALAFAIRLFSVLRFENMIHEYDPYFNLRATELLEAEGWGAFRDWFDGKSWYPLGREAGATAHPGLMITATVAYKLVRAVGIDASLKDVCALIAPWFASNAAMVMFFLGREVKDTGTGLMAAFMLAIVPGYIQRSVAGAYDNEAVVVFAMLLTFTLFIKAVKTGSLLWSLSSALAYLYMAASWGGFVYAEGLIPLYAMIMIASGRHSPRLHIAFSVFYVVGTGMAVQVPFIGARHVGSSEHAAALFVFLLVQGAQLLAWAGPRLPASGIVKVALGGGGGVLAPAAAVAGAALAAASYSGGITPWADRFWALLIPTYSKNYLPIFASVSEHQPATWASFFFDMHVLVILAPAGLRGCFRTCSDAAIFAILYALTSLFFAGTMVRLMLVASPAVALLAAMSASSLLRGYISQGRAAAVARGEGGGKGDKRSKGDYGGSGQPLPLAREAGVAVSAGIVLLLAFYTQHCTWVTSAAYSTPSIVLSATNADGSRTIFDDFREGYSWLRHNTPEDAKVMAWWDYGYQISSMGNRTVIVDNNTWNATHIGEVGRAMASEEGKAHGIARGLGASYVMVVFGGMSGYASDDVAKFLWMVRIGGGAFPEDIREVDYMKRGEYRVDSAATPAMTASLLYKLCYYRFGQVTTERDKQPGWDRVREAEIGDREVELDFFEEVYTSANWLVRIYRLRPEDNRW